MGVSKLTVNQTTVSTLTSGRSGFDPRFLSILFLALPEGTRIVGFEQVEGVFSEGYAILLENPLFKNNTAIYARYDREAAIGPDKELVQFSQFKGFDLTDALGR